MAYYVACDYDEPDRQSYRGIVIIDTLTNEVAHRFFRVILIRIFKNIEAGWRTPNLIILKETVF